MTEDDFRSWLEKAKQSPDRLDAAAYAELAKPSSRHPVVYYTEVEPGLYHHIIGKYDHALMGAMAAE
jgi:cytochrome o ubiquinol oxidase subunit 2